MEKVQLLGATSGVGTFKITAHLALVAFLDDQMIGVGRLIRCEDTDHAEVTVTIADEFQGLGLGTLLLERLAAAAPGIGVYVFEADVLSSNAAMLRVFAASGYDPEITAEGYLQHVVLRVDQRASALARMSRREHQAARRSLEKLLSPRAVAVIGANRQPGTIGHQILVNLIECGFPGPVYPVNPAADEVAGRPAVARVQDLPPPVDLAVIAIRPEALVGVIRDCAEAGVGAVLIVTADFPGDAAARRAAEQDITRFVRSHGMRMIGPTSMGVLSTRAGSAMHATFAPVRPPAGAVAMSSQSGPLGLAILDLAYRADLGITVTVPGDRGPWAAGDTGRGVLRVHSDPLVGPVISFGLAGLFSDLFEDVATAVTPLTDRDASALLASLRAYPLLTGAAGDRAADRPALQDTLLRLSALVEDLPAVLEVTIDPLVIGRPGEGVAAVSPAVRIGEPGAPRMAPLTSTTLPGNRLM